MDRMDMAEATDVVISGCSAGAVQTYINIGANRKCSVALLNLSLMFLSITSSFHTFNKPDKIRSLLPDKMRVTGLPDSGFLVAYDGEGKKTNGPIEKKKEGWCALCQKQNLHNVFSASPFLSFLDPFCSQVLAIIKSP